MRDDAIKDGECEGDLSPGISFVHNLEVQLLSELLVNGKEGYTSPCACQPEVGQMLRTKSWCDLEK